MTQSMTLLIMKHLGFSKVRPIGNGHKVLM